VNCASTATKSADFHKTVLLNEAVEALNIKADGTYVDATYGRGGHSRRILDLLGSTGRLIALDRDPDAVAAAARMTDPRLVAFHMRFSRIGEVLAKTSITSVDGVLLDLGVSSPQIDSVHRGFSFRTDGPLDMRMNTDGGITAAAWLAQASEQEIGEVIKGYGEERFAKQIARAIVAARSSKPIDRTRQLAQIVAKAVPTREPRQDPATRTFQAIRIHINQELEELEIALPQCLEMLSPGGRLVVISFHSLEDRIVKQYMRKESQHGSLPVRLPVRASDLPRPRLSLVGKPVYPDKEEVRTNPRARSAVMRVAERISPC
jgi:16S rRNA (cytosine1402-N4)-methyltransferase